MVGDLHFQLKRNIKVLGSVISLTQNWNEELHDLLSRVNKAWYANSADLMSRAAFKARVQLYRQRIVPIFMYGCETRTIRRKFLKALDFAHWTFLARMRRFPRKEYEGWLQYRIRTFREIRTFWDQLCIDGEDADYFEPLEPISEKIIRRHFSYMGHFARFAR